MRQRKLTMLFDTSSAEENGQERASSKTMARNYGIDALRVVSIFFVVILHVMGHGGVLAATENAGGSWQSAALLLESSALCAVDCFVLISGFVLCKADFKSKRIITLWLTAFFYSAVITITINCIMPGYIEDDAYIWSFFPILGDNWWFFTCYFGLFCFMPFCNMLTKNLTLRQASILLVSCFLVLSVLPLLGGKDLFVSGRGYSFGWFIVLYLMGGCLRVRRDAESENETSSKALRNLAWLLGYALCVIAAWRVQMLADTPLNQQAWFALRLPFVECYDSPFVIGSALCLFNFFSRLPIKENTFSRGISWVSGHIFAVYLISDNAFLRALFMSDAFGGFATLSPCAMTAHVLLVALTTVIVCLVIDIVRDGLFWALRVPKVIAALGSKIDALLALDNAKAPSD